MNYDQMLYQICEERGIQLQFLSRNWIKRLEKGAKVRHIVGYKFDLNSQATSLIADDKFATFEVLSFAQIPVMQHAILYSLDNRASYALGCNTLGYAMEILHKYHDTMVIKANTGTCGRQVLKITNASDLAKSLPKVFQQSNSASLCPFYNIEHEYRIVLLDGEEKLSYMKTKTAHAWFNLDLGAKMENVPADRHARILEIAQRAAKALNLRFGSVDIIETTDEEFLVLEINSGVMTKHYLKQHPDEYGRVKSMYAEAIERMFR